MICNRNTLKQYQKKSSVSDMVVIVLANELGCLQRTEGDAHTRPAARTPAAPMECSAAIM